MRCVRGRFGRRHVLPGVSGEESGSGGGLQKKPPGEAQGLEFQGQGRQEAVGPGKKQLQGAQEHGLVRGSPAVEGAARCEAHLAYMRAWQRKN